MDRVSGRNDGEGEGMVMHDQSDSTWATILIFPASALLWTALIWGIAHG